LKGVTLMSRATPRRGYAAALYSELHLATCRRLRHEDHVAGVFRELLDTSCDCSEPSVEVRVVWVCKGLFSAVVRVWDSGN